MRSWCLWALMAIGGAGAVTLDVRVLLPGGRPAVGAKVAMVDCGCGRRHRGVTDAAGRCRLQSHHFCLAEDGAVVAWDEAGLAADTTAHRLRPPRWYFPGWEQGLITSPVLTFDDWQPDTPISHAEPVRLTLTLAPWVTAGGRLLAEDGQPMAGATVRLARLPVGRGAQDTAAVPDGLDLSAVSDGDGRWQAARWPACDGVLEVSHPKYHVIPLDEGDAWTHRRPRYRLAPATSVSGRVLDVLGRPVRGAVVVANACGDVRGTAVSSRDGQYEFGDLGTEAPWAEAVEVSLSSWAGPWAPGEPAHVPLVRGTVVRGVDLVARPGSLLEIRFTEARTGRGVPDVSVWGPEQSAYSGTDGRARRWLDAAEVVVRYRLPWDWFNAEAADEAQLVLTPQLGEHRRVTVALYRGRRLRGWLTRDGVPLADIRLEAEWSHSGGAGCWTGPDGSFEFAGLPSGQPVDLVTHDENYQENGRWTVPAGRREVRIDTAAMVPAR